MSKNKKPDTPLKVESTFEELMKVATKGNPKPKQKVKKRKKEKKD